MAEWLYEEGIGEDRAILVENGVIVEAIIELPGRPVRAGAVLSGRLTSILIPGKRGIVALEGNGEALLEPLPSMLSEGSMLHVEVLREAIAEAGGTKLPKVRATDAAECEAPSLPERLATNGAKLTKLSSTGPDMFEQAGWSELLEEAASGEIAFTGGALRMSLTPAMTLFDVDGALAPAALAVAGAGAAARAIRRFGICGSIGIDLPTLPSREERQAAAAAFDAVLPQPYERTAVNGFGFLQIVRRRERASIPEIVQGDPAGASARALLRLAERTPGAGQRTLHAAPAVAAHIERHPEWMKTLSRRIGASVSLQAEQGLAISAGYVHGHFA